jgi:DNA-binding NtrC family response regulator
MAERSDTHRGAARPRPQSDGGDASLLIVDDDAGQRQLLETFLKGQGFAVLTAASGEAGLALLGARPAGAPIGMIISDVRMPGISGLEMLHQVRTSHPNLPVLLVTAYADIRDAVAAMRDGAVNYLEKPIDLDELLSSVRLGLGLGEPLKVAEAGAQTPPPGMVAQSPQMRQALREISFVAATDSRVLITGENGVGKEVIADLVHSRSSRADGPFVKVNCAAIPEALLESELFGHERGSFTGAHAQRIGCFEQANGGTILLDEIGEMPHALQAKLLRVTQDGSFRRIGDQRDRRVDTRVLAATNHDLEADVREGRFREDLFFRLNVFEIHIAPLRERREDILPLANLFAAQISGGRPRLSPSTVACLEIYDWPGNVRELRNAMERAVLMARGEMILPEHLPGRVKGAAAPPATAGGDGKAAADAPTGRIEEVERTVILQTLRDNRYNRSETARVLGISRRALLYKLQRFREQGYLVEQQEAE